MSLAISALALAVSMTVAWLTLFRRGQLVMTRPAFVGFVWDTPGGEPKVFLRAMLYTTGKRGYIVEALYLKMRHKEKEHIFSFWTLKQDGAMKIGAGTRVDEGGVSADFHFLPPKDAHSFQFLPGKYEILIYATIVNRSSSTLLRCFTLSLAQKEADAMRPNMMNGVFFNWQPERKTYHSYVDSPPIV